MTRNKIFAPLLLFLFILTGFLSAQTTKEEFQSDPRFVGGLYCPYPTVLPAQAPPPAGYVPFYISHYGRHGSRYTTSPNYHTGPIAILSAADKAGKLTQTGKDLLKHMLAAAADAEGRYGDLTTLGAKEQKGIADRMFKSYPQVFTGKNFIYCRSTQVPRCILSMAAFDERLKELNPELDIVREASVRNKYLNNDPVIKNDTIKLIQAGFIKKHFHPERLLASLFTDTAYARKAVTDPWKFANQLYTAAVNLRNIEQLHFTMVDIFTPDELYILWQHENLFMYYLTGPSGLNGKNATASAALLLGNILDCADSAIGTGKTAADFRFGHDSYIVPLLSILGVRNMDVSESDPEKVASVWCNFKAAPMASNVQVIFFRNPANDDILVKVLHCETEVHVPVPTDIFPYYHWKNFRAYYKQKLAEYFSGMQNEGSTK